MEELIGHYFVAKNKPTDINEHIHTLQNLASECSHIIECGVRSCVSSWAFLYGLTNSCLKKPKVLIGVDLELHPNVLDVDRVARSVQIQYSFLKGNDLEVDLPETDLLFIDTWHVYGHLKRELDKLHRSVRKYIVLHDTEVDGDVGETVRMGFDADEQSKRTGIPVEEIKKGLKPALIEFLQAHPEFGIKAHYTFNNGLTVLERKYVV